LSIAQLNQLNTRALQVSCNKNNDLQYCPGPCSPRLQNLLSVAKLCRLPVMYLGFSQPYRKASLRASLSWLCRAFI